MTIVFVNFRISVVTRLLLYHLLITTIKVSDKNLREEGFILVYSLKIHSLS